MPTIHMHHTVIENAQHQQAKRVFALVSVLSLEPGVLRVLHKRVLFLHKPMPSNNVLACKRLSAEQDVGRATLHCTCYTVMGKRQL